MVMVTPDIPKEIEHFKVEHELKDKREAICMLLRRCMPCAAVERGSPFMRAFMQADKTKMHKLTAQQIKAMDSDVYE